MGAKHKSSRTGAKAKPDTRAATASAKAAKGARKRSARANGNGALPFAGMKAAAMTPGEPATLLAMKIDPDRLLGLQAEYSSALGRLMADMLEAKPQPQIDDKRFTAPAWQGSHGYLASLYLLNARFMTQLAESVDAEPKTRAKVRFAVQQWVDAMAPSNYLATNPEAQQRLIETQGQSLADGLANMLADVEKGRISQTDENAFEVGRNVATTAGDVVFQNAIFQLIQYRPTTAKVFERPLLMVPPCINKFYILDLQPDNSFVRNAVDAGHTVFMMSWKNPDANDAALTWDDYIEDGILQAIAVVQDISAMRQLDLLGFCVGGTMLATGLAVLAARGEEVARSLTLLTTLLDFSDTGVLDVFVDEAAVQTRERTIGGIGGPVGLMPARDLATSFSFLRPNDLVWNYVVNNYLKGEAPAPFDLLYWNSDSTNLPGPYFAWYLRNTYLENRLKEPGGVVVCGEAVDFGAIDVPTYLYGSREDHIVPWGAAFASAKLLSGPIRFVLGASGHIAGVINPPHKRKRSFWVGSSNVHDRKLDANAWLARAREAQGSWWPDWNAWLAQFSGRLVKAPLKPGNKRYTVREPAPGSYVRARAV
jgi:polyhydroxyalkanoate synthase